MSLVKEKHLKNSREGRGHITDHDISVTIDVCIIYLHTYMNTCLYMYYNM